MAIGVCTTSHARIAAATVRMGNTHQARSSPCNARREMATYNRIGGIVPQTRWHKNVLSYVILIVSEETHISGTNRLLAGALTWPWCV